MFCVCSRYIGNNIHYVYSDPRFQMAFQGEVLSPSPLLVTAQKPDLVIIDIMEEKMDILELTVPLETNIKNANAQKMNKYNWPV